MRNGVGRRLGARRASRGRHGHGDHARRRRRARHRRRSRRPRHGRAHDEVLRSACLARSSATSPGSASSHRASSRDGDDGKDAVERRDLEDPARRAVREDDARPGASRVAGADRAGDDPERGGVHERDAARDRRRAARPSAASSNAPSSWSAKKRVELAVGVNDDGAGSRSTRIFAVVTDPPGRVVLPAPPQASCHRRLLRVTPSEVPAPTGPVTESIFHEARPAAPTAARVVDDRRLAAASAVSTATDGPESAPARPEDERQEESEDPHDHEDDADGVQVDSRDAEPIPPR